MTECVRYAPMIGARPGELSDEETRAMSEHLAACEACQARLADEEATSGLVSDALMAEANRRDFSTFADGVLDRVEHRGVLSRLGRWARRHRAAAIASALAPAAVALALVVYFGAGSPSEQQAVVEVTAEGRGTMVLQTSDGPVVLIGNADSEGT